MYSLPEALGGMVKRHLHAPKELGQCSRWCNIFPNYVTGMHNRSSTQNVRLYSSWFATPATRGPAVADVHCIMWTAAPGDLYRQFRDNKRRVRRPTRSSVPQLCGRNRFSQMIMVQLLTLRACVRACLCHVSFLRQINRVHVCIAPIGAAIAESVKSALR